MFHAYAINGVDYSFGINALDSFRLLLEDGNVGVDMFLFLSGVCLYFSFRHNGDIVGFLGKRFVRVIPAVWLVDGVYWFVYYGVLKGNWVGFVSRVSLARFWMTGDSTIWFVSLILLLYLAYPLIYHFLFSEKAKYAGLFRFMLLIATAYALILMLWKTNNGLYEQIEIAITRIPVFIFGVWWSQFVYEKREVPRVCAVLVVIAAVAFICIENTGIIEKPFERFFYLIGGVSISYSVALVCCLFDRLPKERRVLYRFLSWTGGFSLELYITHVALNQILRMQPFYVNGDLGQYAAMAVVAFVLAWAVMKSWISQSAAFGAEVRGLRNSMAYGSREAFHACFNPISIS